MKKIIVIFKHFTGVALLLFLSFQINAQSKIKGYVTDSENEEGIPFASVIVYPANDSSMVTGTTTDLEGKFEIPELKNGNYTIRVQVIGYEAQNIPVNVINTDFIDLAQITLNPSAKLIDEVIIEAEKNPIEATSEGITIQADANSTQEGGTALDLLRNTPSVNVDASGNISLRGATNVTVLIDGRNSTLANNLEQIPISAIQEIKIITNPGAKYDAQGVAGVIDIRLKKGDKNQKKQGLKGNIQATLGSRERANFSLGLNYKKPTWNVFVNYNKNNGRRIQNSNLWRENSGTLLTQESKDDFRIFSDNLKAGADIKITPNATLGIESVLGFTRFESTETVLSQWQNSSNVSTFRNAAFQSEGYNLDNALNFTQNFSSKDHFLTLAASYSFSERDFPREISAFLPQENNRLQSGQKTKNDVLRTFTVLQADYAQPFDNQWKVEAGWKTTMRLIDNDFVFQDLNFSTNTYSLNTAASNRFRYDEKVHAAYFILQKQWAKWKMTAGVRAEQTLISTTLFNTNEQNEQNYLNFFPSALIEYKLSDKQFLRASYTRRINRPNDRWLNPFVNVADSLNIFTGNPQLKPEFINSFEVAYGFNTAKTTFQTSFFYRQTENWFDFVGRVENGVAFRRPENLNTSLTYGIEVIVSSDLKDWWKVNGSITLFEARVDGTNLDDNFTNQNVAWSGKLVSDVKLPQGFSLQITGNYTAPEAEAQGTESEQYYIDLGLKKTFWDNSLSLTLNLRDAFNTWQEIEGSRASNFTQERFRKDDTQILLLGVSYKF